MARVINGVRPHCLGSGVRVCTFRRFYSVHCGIVCAEHCSDARDIVAQVLQPLGHFSTADARAQYPDISAGEFVQQELESICLKG